MVLREDFTSRFYLFLSGNRKKSAPALLARIRAPEIPPRYRGPGSSTGHVTSYSQEDLVDAYATVDVPPDSKSFKGHRRNRSADLDSREDSRQTNSPKLSGGKKGFIKSHRRMKSHETITTVFSQPPLHEKDVGVLSSGKSSVESSSGESGSGLKEIHGSTGEHYYCLLLFYDWQYFPNDRISAMRNYCSIGAGMSIPGSGGATPPNHLPSRKT